MTKFMLSAASSMSSSSAVSSLQEAVRYIRTQTIPSLKTNTLRKYDDDRAVTRMEGKRKSGYSRKSRHLKRLKTKPHDSSTGTDCLGETTKRRRQRSNICPQRRNMKYGQLLRSRLVCIDSRVTNAITRPSFRERNAAPTFEKGIWLYLF